MQVVKKVLSDGSTEDYEYSLASIPAFKSNGIPFIVVDKPAPKKIEETPKGQVIDTKVPMPPDGHSEAPGQSESHENVIEMLADIIAGMDAADDKLFAKDGKPLTTALTLHAGRPVNAALRDEAYACFLQRGIDGQESTDPSESEGEQEVEI